MDTEKLYYLLGYVKVSPYRTKTLKSIEHELKIPSQIAKSLNLKTSQISTALSDLKKENLVECVNEEVRKGRLYRCTELGKEVLKYID